jgi:hypothetical protein
MHLTDDQLNEYLDHESTEREYIEVHLAFCDECAARLNAFQILFAELDSLPEVMLSRNLAARFAPTGQLTPQLPRWLTLTATLQAVFALITLILAAPFVVNLLPSIAIPPLTEILLQIQTQWLTLFDIFTNYQLPSMPSLPPLQIPTLTLAFTLVGASVLWLLGNGLLLMKIIR